MLDVLSLVVPYFAVILCGYFAVGSRLLDQSGVHGVNQLVLWFALPALLFSLMARSDLAGRFEPDFILGYFLTSLLMLALLIIIGRRLFAFDSATASVWALGGIYGNVGYMGVALVIGLLDDGAALPVMLLLFIDVGVMVPLVMVLLALRGADRSAGWLALLRGSFGGLLRNPIMLAIVGGMLFSLAGLPMPDMLGGFLDLIGAAAAPAALFALGATLYGRQVRGLAGPALSISMVKLFLHPLLLFVMLGPVFGLSEDWVLPALLCATMPVAATVFVVAQQYQVFVLGSSTAILVSTALSLVSVSVLFLYLPIWLG